MKTLGELMIEASVRAARWAMFRNVAYVVSAIGCAAALIKLAFFSE